MGVRGELFSTRMACDGRTYFFNVKQNRVGDLYLTIVESKPTEPDAFDRRSIVVFQESSGEFLKALGKAIEAMHETAPELRDAKPPRVRRDAMAPRDDGRDDDKRLTDDEKPRHYISVKRPRADEGGTCRPGPRERGPAPDGAGRRPSGAKGQHEARRASGGTRSGAARAAAEAAGGKPSGARRPAGQSEKGRVILVKRTTKSQDAAAAKPRKLKVRKADRPDSEG